MRRRRVAAVVLVLVGCTNDSLEESADRLGSVAGIVPSMDVSSSGVVGQPDPTSLFRNLDDGTSSSSADDGASVVASTSGRRTSVVRVGYAGAPPGRVTDVAVRIRARRDTARKGNVRVDLYGNGTLLARGVSHALGAAWAGFGDDFQGLSVADAGTLATELVLENTSSRARGTLQVTQVWIDATLETCSPSSCDDGDPCTTDSCDAALGCRHDRIDCGGGGGGPPVSDVIPADRRIRWQPGVPGGIPHYPVCAVTAASRGAVPGDGRDDTAAIQAALDACPADTALLLPAGTYDVSTTITIPSHRVLRGEGIDRTVLDDDLGGASSIVAFGGDAWAAYDRAWNTQRIALAVAGHKDDASITLTSASGVHPDDMILIDRVDDGDLVDAVGQEGLCTWCSRDGGTRTLGQMTRVTGVSGNVVDIDPPLYWDYPTSLSPEATPAASSRVTQWAGVEELTVTQPAPNSDRHVDFSGAAYSWLENVELENISSRAVLVTWSLGCEIRDSYIHEAINGAGHDAGYGVTLGLQSTANLVENNIVDRLNSIVLAYGGAAGNVIAYNYQQTNLFDSDWWLTGAFAIHGAHPIMNLFEGNVSAKFMADFIHGSASHLTLFRNRQWGYQVGKTQANVAVGFEEKNTRMNVVGNVLGVTGVSNLYQGQRNDDDVQVYDLGGAPGDPNVVGTLLRFGNWDAVHGCVWDDAAGHCLDAAAVQALALPASLYLSAKPSWFGDLPWPSIGPDVNPMDGRIPAQVRFEQLSR
jgi:slime mold repeat-containing protein/pectate lyase-like protein